MDYYQMALDKVKVAILTKNSGFYTDSIYASCLAIEFFLKSVINRVSSAQKFEFNHDVINLYHEIRTKYPSKKDLSKVMKYCRKYINESRYPYNGTDAFTDAFAEEFLAYVEEIKQYVDNECQATVEDLKKKFD
ncbi:MAG: HEPN domain-containing protein [Oscillospiraceae bacterium]|nr:HEPN domain-containing protein [Oscillospiraceae bacterium]